MRLILFVTFLLFIVSCSSGQSESKNYENEQQLISNKKNKNNLVFGPLQRHAEFPGGEDSLSKFIFENTYYPKQAVHKGIEGIVYVEFNIDTSGNVTNCNIKRGLGYGCDEESIRLIKSMPKWKPASINGKLIDQLFILPVTFRLDQ